jgi:lysyl-tRNA synthetase class 2
VSWRPTASWENLRRRAELLARLRQFFARRGVLEVETPLLASAPASDPHLHSLSTRYVGPGAASGRTLYLQTSPEFAMKRLLAAGSGPIYQLCKAFRDDEAGRHHNPEFTLLEWYRPGFDHHALMDEVDALLGEVFALPAADRLSYAEAFQRHLDLDPHSADIAELRAGAGELGQEAGLQPEDRDGWLALLLSHRIQPRLGQARPTFVFDFPASQAALARVRCGSPPLAERFELFVGGLELANGYHELTDAAEQARRFRADQAQRRALGLSEVPLDLHLLAALEHGLPHCAGVALGVDRALLAASGAQRLDEVIAFPIERA